MAERKLAHEGIIRCRVSTDKQKVDMQLQELHDFIKRSGWTLHNKYIDHGYTGSKTNRLVFSKKMTNAEARRRLALYGKTRNLIKASGEMSTALERSGRREGKARLRFNCICHAVT